MLAANMGVLAGIIFLAVEIQQSNRIATRDARSELSEQNAQLELAILSNNALANVMGKLQIEDVGLTDEEAVQASSFAVVMLTRAATINFNLESGFLTNDVALRHTGVLVRYIQRYPGIAIFLKRQLEEGPAPREGISLAYDAIYEELGMKGFPGASPLN